MYRDNVGQELRTAAVIPCFKVARQIKEVITTLPPQIDLIIVVDDFCPEGSGNVALEVNDDRVVVVRHAKNLGVGGAMKSGYLKALEMKAHLVLKIDGDGQMDPSQINNLLMPILTNSADYSKGNRFYSLQTVNNMPKIRLIGNVILSFLSKISTGFYHIFDPNNGFTSITSETLELIELNSVDDRYFFESDMLYQVNAIGKRAQDVPMKAIYGDEISNLHVGHSIFYFLYRHIKNFFKRIALTYFIRDFNLASIQLMIGLIVGVWGTFIGLSTWITSKNSGVPSQPGTIVLVAILCITSLQLLLSFVNYDISLSKRNKS